MERQLWHLPKQRSLKVSCIASREKSEGLHLREDKATRRHGLAFCRPAECRVGRFGLGVARVGTGPGISADELSRGPRQRGEF
jgi:hypothetical protein